MALLPSHGLRTREDLARFEAEMPLEQRLPERSILDVFISAAARWPERSALIQLMTGAPDEQPRRVGYAELLGLVRRAANLFAALAGPRPGVAYMLPALVETHATLWGAEAAGYAVPINFLLQPDAIAGLVEASELNPPIFTPASKAEIGAHDENVSFDVIAAKHGEELASKLRDRTIELYSEARAYALSRGLILADTKFEFGLDAAGELILADEVFTPDSSRYWPAEGYEPGRVQPSFDKQYVRDWLTSAESGWDRKSDTPPPPLPADVVEATRQRYVEAYERLTGRSFADWLA